MSTGQKITAWRRTKSWLAEQLCFMLTLVSLVFLLLLIYAIISKGAQQLSWSFLTSLPLDNISQGRYPGIGAAILGSLWILGMTIVISIPVGIATAIYLEEYAGNNWWTRLVNTNIATLAGVPSIVYGILGLGLFVRTIQLRNNEGELLLNFGLNLKPCMFAGALTLALVILPTIIIASQEALRAVPNSLRLTSLALGATRWQTIWFQVLPVGLPGILTGVILALSRAIGEAAPLITVGAVVSVTFYPTYPFPYLDGRRYTADAYSVLPVQIFNWSGQPDEVYRELAAAGIIVLMTILLILNGITGLLRIWAARRIRA